MMLESVKANNFAKSRMDIIAKKAHIDWERETERGYSKIGTTEVDCLSSN